MTWRTPAGDVALSGTRGSGTHTSGPLVFGPGITDLLVATYVSAASGTSPTLAVSLEQSPDGSSWTTVPGSAAATLNAAGNTLSNATVTQPFVRVTAVVGGTTPSFTFRVAVLVFAD